MTDITTPVADGQGAPAPAAAPAVAAPAPAAPSFGWLPNADETTVGYVQNKGWTEPAQVLDGYRNLEKLFGADRAGNTVMMPKADATPEEMGKFYDRLGRPSDAAGYKLEMPQTGGDPEFAKTASGWFHELGLSEKQGRELAGKWNAHISGLQTAQDTANQQKFQADDMSLKSEWGQAYTQNLNHAQAAVRGLGVSPEQIDAMSSTMGHKATMELFQKIGSRMGESDFVTGDKLERFGNALTPGQAKAEIQSLREDKGFVAKLLSKDKDAMTKWTQLHQFAFPSEQP